MSAEIRRDGARCCCAHKQQLPSRPIRRLASAAGWVLPGATLMLMPKCPACVAAYFAAATGLGITLSTASYVRSAALVACAVTLSAMSLVLFVRLRHLR